MVRALTEINRYLIQHSQVLPLWRQNATSVYQQQQDRTLLRDLLLAEGGARPGGTPCSPEHGLKPFPRITSFDEVQSPQQTIELEKVGAALSHLDELCRLASCVRLEAADWRNFR